MLRDASHCGQQAGRSSTALNRIKNFRSLRTPEGADIFLRVDVCVSEGERVPPAYEGIWLRIHSVPCRGLALG